MFIIIYTTITKTFFSSTDEEEDDTDDTYGYSFKDKIRRDEKRWKTADLDHDGKLNRKEFTYFQYSKETDEIDDSYIDVSL